MSTEWERKRDEVEGRLNELGDTWGRNDAYKELQKQIEELRDTKPTTPKLSPWVMNGIAVVVFGIPILFAYGLLIWWLNWAGVIG